MNSSCGVNLDFPLREATFFRGDIGNISSAVERPFVGVTAMAGRQTDVVLSPPIQGIYPDSLFSKDSYVRLSYKIHVNTTSYMHVLAHFKTCD